MNTANHSNTWLFFQRRQSTGVGVALHDDQVRADGQPRLAGNAVDLIPTTSATPCSQGVLS